MAKRNEKKNRQIKVHMTQHRKLKTKEHEPHQKLGVIWGAPEGWADPAANVTPVVSIHVHWFYSNSQSQYKTNTCIQKSLKQTIKMARAYSKFLSEVPYFLLFYSLQKVNQIGRKKK